METLHNQFKWRVGDKVIPMQFPDMYHQVGYGEKMNIYVGQECYITERKMNFDYPIYKLRLADQPISMWYWPEDHLKKIPNFKVGEFVAALSFTQEAYEEYSWYPEMQELSKHKCKVMEVHHDDDGIFYDVRQANNVMGDEWAWPEEKLVSFPAADDDIMIKRKLTLLKSDENIVEKYYGEITPLKYSVPVKIKPFEEKNYSLVKTTPELREFIKENEGKEHYIEAFLDKISAIPIYRLDGYPEFVFEHVALEQIKEEETPKVSIGEPGIMEESVGLDTVEEEKPSMKYKEGDLVVVRSFKDRDWDNAPDGLDWDDEISGDSLYQSHPYFLNKICRVLKADESDRTYEICVNVNPDVTIWWPEDYVSGL